MEDKVKQRFIIIQDVKTPYVLNTNMPHKPQETRFRLFKKGEIFNGVLHSENGKPKFILVNNKMVIPLAAAKVLVAKDVTANFDAANPKEKLERFVSKGNAGVKYMDLAILGALLGIGAVWVLEKKNVIKEPNKNNKMYGAGIGALAGIYFVYRTKNK